MTTHTSQLPRSKAFTRLQPHRSKPHAHRVVNLRRRRCRSRVRSPMASRAQGHLRARLRRMRRLRVVTSSALHPRRLARLMAAKTPLGIHLRLHHPQSRLSVRRGPKRMPRRQAQLIRRRVPTHPMFHPLPINLQHRSLRLVPGSEHPLNHRLRLLPALRNRHALVRIRVSHPAFLAQRLSRKPHSVVRPQSLRMQPPRLVLMTRCAPKRYCDSENKSCCVASSLAESRFTAANSRAASAFRPSAW